VEKVQLQLKQLDCERQAQIDTLQKEKLHLETILTGIKLKAKQKIVQMQQEIDSLKQQQPNTEHINGSLDWSPEKRTIVAAGTQVEIHIHDLERELQALRNDNSELSEDRERLLQRLQSLQEASNSQGSNIEKTTDLSTKQSKENDVSTQTMKQRIHELEIAHQEVSQLKTLVDQLTLSEHEKMEELKSSSLQIQTLKKEIRSLKECISTTTEGKGSALDSIERDNSRYITPAVSEGDFIHHNSDETTYSLQSRISRLEAQLAQKDDLIHDLQKALADSTQEKQELMEIRGKHRNALEEIELLRQDLDAKNNLRNLESIDLNDLRTLVASLELQLKEKIRLNEEKDEALAQKIEEAKHENLGGMKQSSTMI
jgi:chromosome segregation ATPase